MDHELVHHEGLQEEWNKGPHTAERMARNIGILSTKMKIQRNSDAQDEEAVRDRDIVAYNRCI